MHNFYNSTKPYQLKNNWFNRNTNTSIIIVLIGLILSLLLVCFLLVDQNKDEKLRLNKELHRQDSIIRSAELVDIRKDSIISSFPYIPESWKEQTRKERYEQMMDQGQNVEFDNSK